MMMRSITQPLLAVACTGSEHRRRRAGSITLDSDAVQHFNRWLQRCGTQLKLDEDTLACIARLLLANYASTRLPSPVAERMRCGAMLELMMRDRDWQPADTVAEIGAEVVGYLRSDGSQLIPNSEPVVGRMDDAIVIEGAWPLAEPELQVYCDYRHIRQLEAELRHVRPQQFHFNRADYEEAREAYRGLLARQRSVGLASYVGNRPARDGPLLF